jgi:hypothetical protein
MNHKIQEVRKRYWRVEEVLELRGKIKKVERG